MQDGVAGASRQILCSKTGHIISIQGQVLHFYAGFDEHDCGEGPLKVGDPIRESFFTTKMVANGATHLGEGVSITANAGRVTKLELRIEDQDLLEALEQ